MVESVDPSVCLKKELIETNDKLTFVEERLHDITLRHEELAHIVAANKTHIMELEQEVGELSTTLEKPKIKDVLKIIKNFILNLFKKG